MRSCARLVPWLLLLLPSTAALAAPINYGDVTASHVVYRQVTEETLSLGDADGLFGAPTAAGNSIDFNPLGFVSQSAGALGFDITDVELTFGIDAKTGMKIDSILLTETGDYTLIGAGGLGTLAAVAANVIIEVLEVDFVSITPVQINTSLTFMPSNGDYNLQDDRTAILQAWTGSLNFDVAAFLLANNIDGNATFVQVTLDNQLVTTSENGTTAFIAKKDADGLSVTTVIPEPSTGLLLAAGLFAIAARRRARA